MKSLLKQAALHINHELMKGLAELIVTNCKNGGFNSGSSCVHVKVSLSRALNPKCCG